MYAVDSITEKLVSFASKISYRFEYVDESKTLRQLAPALAPTPTAVAVGQYLAHDTGESGAGETACIECLTMEPTPPVKLDPEQFPHSADVSCSPFYARAWGRKAKSWCLPITACLDDALRQASGCPLSSTGKGRKLSPEEFQQLFDPFCMEKAPSLMSDRVLSIEKIIEEHGGRLDVQQEKAGDTSFVIVLPVAR